MFRKLVITALVIVVVVPILAIAVFAGFLMYEQARYGRGEYPFADVSSFTSGPVTVSLERFRAHVFLAEYQRFITIEVGGKSTRHEIPMDTGGTARMDICRNSTGALLLRDRMDVLMISDDGALSVVEDAYANETRPDGGVRKVLTPEAAAACVDPVGRFDTVKGTGYGFISL